MSTRVSKARVFFTVLSLAIASLGGAACSCQPTKSGLKPNEGVDPLAGKLGVFVVGSKNVVLPPNRDVVLKFLVAMGGENGTPIGGARVEFSKTGAPDSLLGS